MCKTAAAPGSSGPRVSRCRNTARRAESASGAAHGRRRFFNANTSYKLMTGTATEEGAIDTDAQRADAQFNEGNALMQAGRFAEAAAAYRRSLALNRTAPRTHNNLAVALAEQRK